MSVIDWLLEEDAPPVAYLWRERLLCEDTGSRRLRRANDYPPIAQMIKRVDEAIAAPRYAKQRGGYWTLHLLAEIQADGRDRAKALRPAAARRRVNAETRRAALGMQLRLTPAGSGRTGQRAPEAAGAAVEIDWAGVAW